jgi:hypothetical protein
VSKEYKVISERYLEDLVKFLNQDHEEGWEVAAYVQEFGVTKILLEREK